MEPKETRRTLSTCFKLAAVFIPTVDRSLLLAALLTAAAAARPTVVAATADGRRKQLAASDAASGDLAHWRTCSLNSRSPRSSSSVKDLPAGEWRAPMPPRRLIWSDWRLCWACRWWWCCCCWWADSTAGLCWSLLVGALTCQWPRIGDDGEHDDDDSDRDAFRCRWLATNWPP